MLGSCWMAVCWMNGRMTELELLILDLLKQHWFFLILCDRWDWEIKNARSNHQNTPNETGSQELTHVHDLCLTSLASCMIHGSNLVKPDSQFSHVNLKRHVSMVSLWSPTSDWLSSIQTKPFKNYKIFRNVHGLSCLCICDTPITCTRVCSPWLLIFMENFTGYVNFESTLSWCIWIGLWPTNDIIRW